MPVDVRLRRSAAHVFVGDVDADRPEVDPSDAHHLSRVLRLRAGEAVTVCDGKGRWRVATVRSVSADAIDLEATSEVVVEARTAPEISIGFVVPKAERPEWIVQKLTELGVDLIAPMTSARSVVRWDPEKSARQHERLVKVAREAAMQSRRVHLPEVRPLAALAPGWVLAEPGGAPVSLEAPAVCVGPEGGWEPGEVADARTVDLGPAILRAETAAIVAATLLVALRSGAVTATF